MKTILITGCSSGFGYESACHFLDKGWHVIATMRNLDEGIFKEALKDKSGEQGRLELLELDVTDATSIANLVESVGTIDALVNNAGIGWLSPFEGTSDENVRRIFETNTFAVFEMIRALLPKMRQQGEGVIVNVSSSVTMKPLPLLAVYTASKAAVNAYTECLSLELAPLGIRTRLVLPGQSPSTSFGKNAFANMEGQNESPQAYQPFVEQVMKSFVQNAGGKVTELQDVVSAIYMAVTDASSPFSIPAGDDAVVLS